MVINYTPVETNDLLPVNKKKFNVILLLILIFTILVMVILLFVLIKKNSLYSFGNGNIVNVSKTIY